MEKKNKYINALNAEVPGFLKGLKCILTYLVLPIALAVVLRLTLNDKSITILGHDISFGKISIIISYGILGVLLAGIAFGRYIMKRIPYMFSALKACNRARCLPLTDEELHENGIFIAENYIRFTRNMVSYMKYNENDASGAPYAFALDEFLGHELVTKQLMDNMRYSLMDCLHNPSEDLYYIEDFGYNSSRKVVCGLPIISGILNAIDDDVKLIDIICTDFDGIPIEGKESQRIIYANYGETQKDKYRGVIVVRDTNYNQTYSYPLITDDEVMLKRMMSIIRYAVEHKVKVRTYGGEKGFEQFKLSIENINME